MLAYKRIGGDRAFVEWCRANKEIFYNGLMAKLLPHELNVLAEIGVTHDPVSDIDVARRILFLLDRAKRFSPGLDADLGAQLAGILPITVEQQPESMENAQTPRKCTRQ